MLVPVFRVVAVAAVVAALVMVARKGVGPESDPPKPVHAEKAEPGDLKPAVAPNDEKPPAAPEDRTAAAPTEERAPAPPSPPASPTMTAEPERPQGTPLERKPGSLPGERAEAERQVQLEAPAPVKPPEPPKPKRLFQVKVEDAGTLKSGDLVIRLGGIETRSAVERCTFEAGGEWPCGAVARAALARVIRGRSVECVLEDKAEGEVVTRCTAGNTDLSQWLVRQGWAEPKSADDAKLADAEADAKRERRGLWQKSRPDERSEQ